MPARKKNSHPVFGDDDDDDMEDPGGMPPVRVMPSTPQGKIGRLTHDTREALNLRLLNNEPAKKILEWLNALVETVTVCAEYWNGEAVSAKNLSDWKNGASYHAWRERRTRVEETKTLMSFATGLASSGGRLAGGVATMVAGDFLETFERMRNEGMTLGDLTNLVEPIVKLASKENEALKLDGQKEERQLRRENLALQKDKLRKTTVAAVRRVALLPETQKILRGNDPVKLQDQKLEQLIFGDLADSPH